MYTILYIYIYVYVWSMTGMRLWVSGLWKWRIYSYMQLICRMVNSIKFKPAIMFVYWDIQLDLCIYIYIYVIYIILYIYIYILVGIYFEERETKVAGDWSFLQTTCHGHQQVRNHSGTYMLLHDDGLLPPSMVGVALCQGEATSPKGEGHPIVVAASDETPQRTRMKYGLLFRKTFLNIPLCPSKKYILSAFTGDWVTGGSTSCLCMFMPSSSMF